MKIVLFKEIILRFDSSLDSKYSDVLARQNWVEKKIFLLMILNLNKCFPNYCHN